MKRHSLHQTEGNEVLKSSSPTETKEILNIPLIKEEIEIITEINESLCSKDNDNSIPFCNISQIKFLDLTPENDNVDRIEVERRQSHRNAQKRYAERKKKENDEIYMAQKRERNLEALKRYRLKKKIEKYELQDATEEVDIEAAINERKKKNAEKQRRHRERERLENGGLQWVRRRKNQAEAMRRGRERKKKENYELYLAKRAEAQRLYRQRKKMKKNELQDVNEEVDIEIANNKSKRNAEKQRPYREKKIEKDELNLANERKNQAEV